eukprot:COSAG01_NODE_4846_length_4690_cov_307.130530_5_plen_138_part_00
MDGVVQASLRINGDNLVHPTAAVCAICQSNIRVPAAIQRLRVASDTGSDGGYPAGTADDPIKQTCKKAAAGSLSSEDISSIQAAFNVARERQFHSHKGLPDSMTFINVIVACINDGSLMAFLKGNICTKAPAENERI